MKSRVYIVDTGTEKLYVRALLKTQAMFFVACKLFRAEIATDKQLKEAKDNGAVVYDARLED